MNWNNHIVCITVLLSCLLSAESQDVCNNLEGNWTGTFTFIPDDICQLCVSDITLTFATTPENYTIAYHSASETCSCENPNCSCSSGRHIYYVICSNNGNTFEMKKKLGIPEFEGTVTGSEISVTNELDWRIELTKES